MQKDDLIILFTIIQIILFLFDFTYIISKINILTIKFLLFKLNK